MEIGLAGAVRKMCGLRPLPAQFRSLRRTVTALLAT